jgi:hypothetical protein
MFLTVDVLEVDVLVGDVLELDVLGARQILNSGKWHIFSKLVFEIYQ